MEYRITAAEDNAYVILKFIGDINRHNSMAHILEAHALGRKLGTNRFLLDLLEATNIDTTVDQYEFVHNDMSHTPGVDKYARVAALVRSNDHSHDFLETVFQNVGFNLRLFHDHAAALNFLSG